MRYLFFITLCFALITTVTAQTEQLARNYAEQGQYEKAVAVLEKLYKKKSYRNRILYDLVEYQQQLENYAEADRLLNERINQQPNLPTLYAELGHNFELQRQTTKAAKYYQTAIEKLELNPNYSSALGKVFEEYNLLDQAVAAYEKGMTLNERLNFRPQLAKIYGEQGNLEKMFDTYLSLIDTNPIYFNRAQHIFGLYISEDPTNEANGVFRKLLLKKLQQQPNITYNEMLSWLFVQQKDYRKAFSQEKAIYKRSEQGFDGIMDLAEITIAANEDETAKEILEYVIESPSSRATTIKAHQILQQLAIKSAKKQQYDKINEEYENLLALFGKSQETLKLQIDYAHFMAFDQDRKQEAVAVLKKCFKQRLSKFDAARVRMELADILVLDEKFNEALIYYSQIQGALKNDGLSQEARFKVAKTSYYKGDFKWAQTQLDVLKRSASQLISNDAMELSLVISDNSLEDSTQTALKVFAKADLLAFQHKDSEAINTYDQILNNHKGEKIEDEALFRQAKLYEKAENFEKAVVNYIKIIEYHGEDILVDDAHFYLASLYESVLDQPEKAKEHYEYIIFNHADSIHFVESRKKYRALRGDAIN